MARTPEEAARRRDARRAVVEKRQMASLMTKPLCALHRTARKRLYS